MLKHVSYRASSTSLTRPFGNCRASNTLSPQGKSPLLHSDNDCTISAPNSPQISQFPRHTRHHSITPDSSAIMLSKDEVDGAKRHTIQSKMPLTPNSSPVANNSYLHNVSNLSPTNSGHVRNSSEDSVCLKSDDPLAKHQKDLRNVESMEVRAELMPDISARQRTEAPDNISLHSTMSFSSLCRNDLRASSTSLAAPKVPVRVHLRQLRPDIEYKTLRLDPETTCRQLIEHLLQKLRLKHRDPNLFAVVLEVAVKGPGGAPPLKKRFLLEDSARPVELQQCRPRGEANFSVTMRRGGVLRVRDSILTPGSQYKSVLVSYTSSVVEVIQLLLRCNNRTDDWRMFTLHEVCGNPYNDRLLNDEDRPLYVQNSWPKSEKQKYSLVLRRHLTQGLMEDAETWRRLSMDECSLDADADLDEHNSSCSSILTSSSNSSRSRSSISSTTASVLSLASISSNGSSRCSFSSNSSSGVSSGSGSSFTAAETPEKKRPVQTTRRILPHIPRAQTPVAKVYPISAEENIQSYFTMPTDEEISPALNSKQSCIVQSERKPFPLPRRILSYPVANITTSAQDEKIDVLTPFSKSWSSASCYVPLTVAKARGPTAQTWQNRSRTARIRSATISSPVEHMANLSLHNRSRSIDQSRSSVNNLTSATSSDGEKSQFAHRSSSLGRAVSASSITSQSKASDYSFAIPSATKLRPLSLAPNSSITFSSRRSSLLSNQSHSTSTLMASSSTLSLASPSVDSKSNSSNISTGLFNVAQSNSSNNTTLISLSPNSEKAPPASSSNIKDERESELTKTDGNVESKTPEVPTESKDSVSNVVVSRCSLTLNSRHETDDTKHCPSCCRYDKCFYI
ncbi:serine-rich adhesin for platelets [Hyalella azteca]|uniref:Serine-rich adhesin for platelets n=1 Tax=Hyalella azteca TaxID=294128 RepID=A0A8B7NSU8_HYAAZ|nr:serine-rich adhesin for platelets [Hyalella azteca]